MTPLEIIFLVFLVIILGYFFYTGLTRSWYHGLRKERSQYIIYNSDLFFDDADEEDKNNDKNEEDKNNEDVNDDFQTAREFNSQMKKLNFTL